MNQTAVLSDSSASNTSLISGLLSQINGNALQNNLFSNLLSQSSDLQSSLTALAQNEAATATPAANFAPPSASFSSASTSNPPSDLMQTLDKLSSTLHHALAVLRQQQNNTQAADNRANSNPAPAQAAAQVVSQNTPTKNASTAQQSQPQENATNNTASSEHSSTPPSSAAPTTPAPAPDNSAPTADTTASAPASPPAATVDPQSLVAIIAQLLMLTQTLTRNLQQAPTGNATIGQIGSAEQGAGQASGGAGLGILGEIKTLMSAATDSTAAPPTTGTSSAPALSLASDAPFTAQLQKLLTGLQKATQQLFPAPTSGEATAQTSTPPVDTASALAALEGGLTKILNVLQQKIQGTPPTQQTPVLAQAAPTPPASEGAKIVPITPPPPYTSTAVQSSPAPTADQPTPVTPPTEVPSKPPLSGTDQSQIIPLVGSPPAQPAAPTGQTFTLNAALTTATNPTGGNSGTDSDVGSDLLSGGKNTASAAAPTTNAPIPADGAQAAGTYNFASTLSAARAMNGGITGLPTPVDQVILQMNRSVKNGDDQISLQLHPADLGKITIKLDIGSDGKVQGSVTADNPQTLAMLQKDSRSLERALQDAGLRADPGSLQFNLGGQSSGGNNTGQTTNNGGNANNGNANGTGFAGNTAELADLGASAETYYLTPSGVNIQV